MFFKFHALKLITLICRVYPKNHLPTPFPRIKICLFEWICVYYNMNENTFWGRVKPLIKAHKMTHKQFAEHIGISPHTFSGWVRHERIPDTGTAYDMAVVLGVTLNYLFGSREA